MQPELKQILSGKFNPFKQSPHLCNRLSDIIIHNLLLREEARHQHRVLDVSGRMNDCNNHDVKEEPVLYSTT